VTRDPPFSRLDLISCRNLLIYLDEFAQRRVLRTFHYALRPQGMLHFGPAESVAQSPELFEQIDSRLRVFRRIPNTGAGGAIAERGDVSVSLALEPEGNAVPLRVEADSPSREADRLLLARFAPACVLVNQALTILQFRGQTGPYLEPAGGARCMVVPERNCCALDSFRLFVCSRSVAHKLRKTHLSAGRHSD
jgi:two-component system CheB/CheR fusion protein